MGVHLDSSTPRNPYRSTSIFDDILGAAGSLGAAFASGFQGILDGIGAILTGAFEAVGAVFNGIVNGVRGLIGAIADGIRGLLPSSSPFSPVQSAFRDGQRDITDRLDLLEGVQGYCAAFQSVNVNAEWGLDNWRYLPYDEPLGPAKNMHVDRDYGEIVLHTAGMFVVYAKAQARLTSYGGNNFAYLDLNILRPNGTVYSWTRVEKFIPYEQHQTVSVAWPVVIPFEGARVEVEVYSDNWRWWDGGTQYSTLHVIQHSNTSINPGQPTVPDEVR